MSITIRLKRNGPYLIAVDEADQVGASFRNSPADTTEYKVDSGALAQ